MIIEPTSDYKKTSSHIIVMTVLFLSSLLFSCGHGPADGKSTFEKRIARLENPKNLEDLHAEQAYFVDSLDIAVLSDVLFREKYLTAWVASFVSPDGVHGHCEKLFGRAAKEMPGLLKPLVADICRILKTRGAKHIAEVVAALPYGIDSKKNPEIASRLLTSTLLPGTPAPPIAGLAPAPEKPEYTLVLFHESACRTCGNIIWELKNHFSDLRSAGVRVVTVSTDTDPQVWEEYAATLPWPDRLCDLRGFYSPPMVAYGVPATPALYLIDRAGKVVDQFAAFAEVWELINNGKR